MSLSEVITGEAASLLRQVIWHTLDFSADEEIEDPNCPTLLLIHGLFFSNKHLKGMQHFLADEGFNTICNSYDYLRKDLYEIESQVVSEAKEAYEQTGKKPVWVGYSAGGLIAASAAQNNPGIVDTVITLGTPYQGTFVASLASLIPGVRKIPAIKQMRFGSDYSKKLRDTPLPKEVKVYSIFSIYDQAVIPGISAAMFWDKGYPNIDYLPVNNAGHIGLNSERVFPLLVDILNE